jgi:hypothetical protein
MKNEIDVESELSRVVDDLALLILPHLRGAAALIETSEAFHEGEELPSALILVADCVRDLTDLQVRTEDALARYMQERRNGVLTLLESKTMPSALAPGGADAHSRVPVQAPRANPPGLASPSP